MKTAAGSDMPYQLKSIYIQVKVNVRPTTTLVAFLLAITLPLWLVGISCRGAFKADLLFTITLAS